MIVNHCQVWSRFSKVRGQIGETHENLAIDLDITDNQCCTSRSDNWVRQKQDGEVTEVLQQEWSWDHAERSFVTTYTLPI